MKQIFVIVCIFLSGIMYAQNQQTELKLGFNVASLNSESDDLTSRISFHAGFGMENQISDQLSLLPEILFSSQGAKIKNGSKREFRLNYVNLPIMLRFYPDSGFYLEAGPQAGILVSARQTAEDEYDSDIENLKGQDYGFNLGLGYKSSSVVAIGARYYFGLRDINDYEFGEKLKNGVLQISLSFYLN